MSEEMREGLGDTSVTATGAGFGAGLLVGAMIGVLGTIAGSYLYDNFVVAPRRSPGPSLRRRQEAGYAYEGRE